MMAVVHYTPQLQVSREAVEQNLPSLKKMGWDFVLQEGYVPGAEYQIMDHSFLAMDNGVKQRTKLACSLNHYRFWNLVVSEGVPMAFVEHDMTSLHAPTEPEYEVEYLAAASSTPVHENRKLYVSIFRDRSPGVYPLEDPRYRLKYPNNNAYLGAYYLPTTGAYACTPAGARRLIAAFEANGAERSDMQINSKTVNVGVRFPAPFECRYNPNTSSGKYYTDVEDEV